MKAAVLALVLGSLSGQAAAQDVPLDPRAIEPLYLACSDFRSLGAVFDGVDVDYSIEVTLAVREACALLTVRLHSRSTLTGPQSIQAAALDEMEAGASTMLLGFQAKARSERGADVSVLIGSRAYLDGLNRLNPVLSVR